MKTSKATPLLVLAVFLLVSCNPQKTKTNEEKTTSENVIMKETSIYDDEPVIIDFTMNDIGNKAVSVRDEFKKNMITVLDFWASWCGPCRQEMPELVNTYNKYKYKGLGIIGISLDKDAGQWKEAVKSMGMTWLQLSDLQGWENSAARKYRIQAIPFTIIVNDMGHVLETGLRGEELDRFIGDRIRYLRSKTIGGMDMAR